MPLADIPLYVKGTELPPYEGEWTLLSEKTYPDAEFDWADAQMFEAYATKDGDPLTLNDALAIEQMVRDKVAEEGGGALATRIMTRLVGLPSGEAQNQYKVYHAAHGSPIAWAAIVAYIAANWKAILIAIGVLAAVTALMTFTIKASAIVWKGGQKIEDLIEELPPAAVAGLGIGLVLLLALAAFGGKREEKD